MVTLNLTADESETLQQYLLGEVELCREIGEDADAEELMEIWRKLNRAT